MPATPVGQSQADFVSLDDSTWTTIAEMTPPKPLKNTRVAMNAPRAGPGTSSARYVDTAFSARATPCCQRSLVCTHKVEDDAADSVLDIVCGGDLDDDAYHTDNRHGQHASPMTISTQEGTRDKAANDWGQRSTSHAYISRHRRLT